MKVKYVGPLESVEVYGVVAAPGDTIEIELPAGVELSSDWERVKETKADRAQSKDGN